MKAAVGTTTSNPELPISIRDSNVSGLSKLETWTLTPVLFSNDERVSGAMSSAQMKRLTTLSSLPFAVWWEDDASEFVLPQPICRVHVAIAIPIRTINLGAFMIDWRMANFALLWATAETWRRLETVPAKLTRGLKS